MWDSDPMRLGDNFTAMLTEWDDEVKDMMLKTSQKTTLVQDSAVTRAAARTLARRGTPCTVAMHRVDIGIGVHVQAKRSPADPNY